MFWFILGLALAPLQHAADLNNGFKARVKAVWAIAGMTDLAELGLRAMAHSTDPWVSEFAVTELKIRTSARLNHLPRLYPDVPPYVRPSNPSARTGRP